MQPSRAERRLTRLALAATGLFLLYALIRSKAIIGAVYSNSDSASALLLAESMQHREGDMVLGNYAWLEPLFVLHWTRWLPEHRYAWELLPLLAWGLTTALVGWTVRRAVDGRAALLVVAALLVPSPLVFSSVASPNAHVHSLSHVVVLSVLLLLAPTLKTRRTLILWALATALTLAPGASSDTLLLITGPPAFALALFVGWRLRLLMWDVAAAGVAAVGIGTLAGLGLKALAEHDGILKAPDLFNFATSDQLAPHGRLLLESVALFAHGRLGGEVDVFNGVHQIVALAVALAVVLLLARLRRPNLIINAQRPASLQLLVVFWLAVTALASLAFVITDATKDLTNARYVVMLWPALLVCGVALLPDRVGRTALAGLVTLTAALGVAEIANGDYTEQGAPGDSTVDQVTAFAKAQGLDHGYAGYWEAAEMAVASDFKLRVYPVIPCGGPSVDGRCPSDQHHVKDWYVPKPGRVRTFYIVNDVKIGTQPLGPPPARWGAAALTKRFGTLTVFVYDFDLAAKLPEGT